MSTVHLVPAAELIQRNHHTLPNESAAYRAARNELLREEIELRRHIERVAEQRRALPPGGEVTGNYRFQSEDGHTVDFAGLFGDKQTVLVYSYMFGPQRERPCPMCTSMLSAWEGEARDMQQRMAMAMVAGAPMERLLAFKRERGWHHLKFYTDLNGDYSRDYHGIAADGSDIPAFNVFTRRDGMIRHFWSSEMADDMSDPGQDPRGAPDPMPMWNVFDMTPEGRGGNWYPKLDYPD
ncbi:DUF899 family protein [Dyella flava]|uniref:DUF899 domain-containing protein n=1 Tax=Dyella flava TaxID=1920170 RepID=A0ABS2K0J6_9GAMM|nr:DUF899 family protein [Dyella flava]MBM7124257.1 DUF899 domain-containing protein [Dyella flava]GLQ50465.1 hypothetical protein GCM10010872_19140 [Dyella flava]